MIEIFRSLKKSEKNGSGSMPAPGDPLTSLFLQLEAAEKTGAAGAGASLPQIRRVERQESKDTSKDTLSEAEASFFNCHSLS